MVESIGNHLKELRSSEFLTYDNRSECRGERCASILCFVCHLSPYYFFINMEIKLVMRKSSPLKNLLGKFAIWVEATFGLYSSLRDALVFAPKTEEDIEKEILILYDILRRSDKKKYRILFRNRCKVAILSVLSLMRPFDIESAIWIDNKGLMEKIRETSGYGISIINTEENVLYYSQSDCEVSSYSGMFRAISGEEYKSFLVLDFLVSRL